MSGPEAVARLTDFISVPDGGVDLEGRLVLGQKAMQHFMHDILQPVVERRPNGDVDVSFVWPEDGERYHAIIATTLGR